MLLLPPNPLTAFVAGHDAIDSSDSEAGDTLASEEAKLEDGRKAGRGEQQSDSSFRREQHCVRIPDELCIRACRAT